MLILLFDGAPSVPKETQTPESSISLIGANPSIRMAEAGQWDTLTPALERESIWKRPSNNSHQHCHRKKKLIVTKKKKKGPIICNHY